MITRIHPARMLLLATAVLTFAAWSDDSGTGPDAAPKPVVLMKNEANDALEDALYGPEEPGAPPRVLVFRDFELLEERDPATARMFLDIVRTVAGNPASTLRGMVRARPSG